MGSTSNSGYDYEPTDDEEESNDEQSGFEDFRDPSEKDKDEPGGEAIGAGSASGLITEAGSSSVVKQPQKSEDNSDEDNEIDSEEERDDDASLPDTEDESDSEDSEDTDSGVITIIQVVDPFSYTSWDMQPVMLRVAEQYRDQVDLRFVPAPVRDFDSEIPETRNGMPLDEPLYSDEPASTEQVNRAWIAAKRQGQGRAYLRRLWMDTFARGRNLDEKTILINIAGDMGFNVPQFEEDMKSADLPSGTVDELPITKIKTSTSSTLEGYLRYPEFGPRLAPEGATPDSPRALPEFVRDYGPVATTEVKEVYDFGSLEDAESELRDAAGVERREIGVGTFWEST